MSTRRLLVAAGLLLVAGACAAPDAPTAPSSTADLPSRNKARPSGPTDPTATFLFRTDPSLGLQGDGVATSGDTTVYADGTCGVAAKIYATTQASNSGDATLSLGTGGSGKSRCSRTLRIRYGSDGPVEQVAAFVNLNALQNTVTVIPLGATEERGLNVADARCDGLRWKPVLPAYGDLETGVHNVLVERVDASTWHVRSQAPHEAYCIRDGSRIVIPVDFVIRASRPLP